MWDPEEKAEKWVELYKEGVMQKEIAKRYEVSPGTVANWLKEKGFKTANKDPKGISQDNVDE